VIATAWGVKAAFWTLAAAGMVAVLLVLIAMPETRVRPPPKPG